VEKVPKPLLHWFIKEKGNFTKLTGWKQWSGIKKAAEAAMKKHTGQEVKSLVFWQHYRKQLLTG